MKRVSAVFALIALIAGGIGAAQTPPAEQPTTPPAATPTTQDPGSTTQPPASQPNAAQSSERATSLKDCIAQKRAGDPQMSERGAQKVCKDAANSSPQR